MIRNFVRTCDLCHKEITAGQYRPRVAEPDGMDLLMILLENLEEDFELTENADGTIGLDTCQNCYSRLSFTHSQALN